MSLELFWIACWTFVRIFACLCRLSRLWECLVFREFFGKTFPRRDHSVDLNGPQCKSYHLSLPNFSIYPIYILVNLRKKTIFSWQVLIFCFYIKFFTLLYKNNGFYYHISIALFGKNLWICHCSLVVVTPTNRWVRGPMRISYGPMKCKEWGV